MIKDLIESITKLITTVRENVFATFIATILILVVLMSYNNGLVLHHMSGSQVTPQVEKVRFQNSLIINDEIDSSLKNLLEKTHGDRAFIKQFHNGKHDLAGLPFTSITTTYLTVKQNVTIPSNAYEDHPLSSMNKVLKSMWQRPDETRCIIAYVESIPDTNYKMLLEQEGVKKVILCPVVNLLNYPIGIIGVSYLNETTAAHDLQTVKQLEELSIKVAGYLSFITENEKTNKSGIHNLFGLI